MHIMYTSAPSLQSCGWPGLAGRAGSGLNRRTGGLGGKHHPPTMPSITFLSLLASLSAEAMAHTSYTTCPTSPSQHQTPAFMLLSAHSWQAGQRGRSPAACPSAERSQPPCQWNVGMLSRHEVVGPPHTCCFAWPRVSLPLPLPPRPPSPVLNRHKTNPSTFNHHMT